MRGKRFVSFIAAVLLCFGMVFGALAPAPVAAQADELSQREFRDLIESVQEDDPAFGPEDGELEHDPEIVSLFSAELELADFLVTVTFANPYAGGDGQFDYGIYFRVGGTEDELRYLQFIVFSNGEWALLDSASEELVAQGTYDDIDDSRRGENELTVYAEGPLVHLGVNGDYLGSAEVEHEDAGDILISTAYLEESRQEGAASEFTDFSIWEIGGSSRSNDDQGEDDPTPDDDQDDSSDRGPLGPRDNGPSRDDEDEETPTEDDGPSRDDEDDPTPDDDDNGQSSGGTVYTAPIYGYTLEYDDAIWEVTSDSSGSFDQLSLTTEFSQLAIYGEATDETPEECAANDLAELEAVFAESGFPDAVTIEDEGEISGGPLDGAAYIEAVLVTVDEEGNDFETTIYLACGPLEGNDAIIVVQHFVPTESYPEEAELREDILATLSAGDGSATDTGNDDGPSRDDEETPVDDEDPTPAPDDEDQPSRDDEDDDSGNTAADGARYESPTYGYTLRFDDSVWELTGESSSDGLDSASFGNGISTVTVLGLSLDATPAECVGALLSSFLTQLEDNGITGEFEVLNEGELSGGSLDGAAVAEVMFTGETDEGTATLVIFTACGPISGSDHYVGVRHFASPDQYDGEAAARDELLTGLFAQGEEPQVETGDEPNRNDEDQPSRDDDDDNGGDSGDVDSPNVSRVDGANVYTSPTYGFSVEILPGFSVEQDTVVNGYDTLVIANSNARITVAGFASSNTAAACADSIVGNLNADPSFTNVNLPIDPETGAPIRIDEEGASVVPVYLTFTENGQQVTVGRLYACFSFTGINGGNSMLVYAYETPADIFIDEFDNILAMLDLIFVP